MGGIDLRIDGLDIDLESGGATTEEDESKDQGLHYVEHAHELFSKLQSCGIKSSFKGWRMCNFTW